MEIDQIYQHLYTLVFIVLFAFTAVMFVVSFKEKRPEKAIGNGLLATFCLFAVLVRFGLIGN